METINKTENKTEMARRLGISRSSLYYKPKRPEIDLENQINMLDSKITVLTKTGDSLKNELAKIDATDRYPLK